MAYSDGNVLFAGSLNSFTPTLFDVVGSNYFLDYDNFDYIRTAWSGGNSALTFTNYGFTGRGIMGVAGVGSIMLVSGNQSSINYQVSVKQKTFGTTNRYGIIIKALNSSNYYCVTITANTGSIQINYVSGGVLTTLVQGAGINVAGANNYDWYDLIVIATGQTIIASVTDPNISTTITSSAGSVWTSGTWGLINISDAKVIWDDFWVSGTG